MYFGKTNAITWRFFLIVLAAVCGTGVSRGYARPAILQTEEAPRSSAGKHVGAIKSISGSAITLTLDSGADINFTLQPVTRIVRVAPGEKDLKNATPIQTKDLQVGDRVLVAEKPGGDNHSLMITTVVVMKRSDLLARREQDLQDWQKRGVDGPSTAVDAAAGTITISVRGKNLVIHTSTRTIIRRYAPDSVKF